MAKKQTKNGSLSLDDYDFGSEFDFEDFDMQPKPIKTKREALERVGSGILEGALSAVKSPSFYRSLIKKVLPRGYGDMFDIADHSATTIRELYNEGVKEVKPALKDLARTTEKLMPSIDQYLPKSAKELAKKFVDSNKEQARFSVDSKTANDIAVAAMMQETFKYNAEQGARQNAKQDIKDQLSQTLTHERHQDEMAQLDGIRRPIVQMAAYQSKIEYGFHRKSLELQMRHYFVAVDSLNEQRKHHVAVTEHLAGILNNTALPDFVKLKNSERFKDMMRNKFMGSLQDGIFSGRANYVQRLGKAIREQALGGLKGFAGGIRDGAAGIDMALDASAQADEFGIDKVKMAGNQVGALGAEWLGKLGGKLMGNKLNASNSKFAKGVRRLGNKLQYGASNAPQILNDFSNSHADAKSKIESMLEGKVSDKWKDRLSSFFGALGDPMLDISRGTIRRANAMDTRVQQNSVAELGAPSVFSNRAQLTLVEIIPGLLARILQEQQIARTGNTGIDLVQYDFSRKTFSSTKAVRGATFNKLFGERAKKGVENEQNHLLEMIDPEGKLTPEQRKILGNRLMADNLGRRSGYEAGRIGNYTKAGAFSGSPTEAAHAETFTQLFKDLHAKDQANENRLSLDFSRRFSETGRSMNDNRALVQELLEIYPRDMLEHMKILKPESNEIDMAQMYRYFGGEEYKAEGIKAIGDNRRQKRLPSPRRQRITQEPPLEPSHPLPQPIPASSETGLIAEIKRLISVIEEQNIKPLVSDIKDLLMLMKEKVSDVENNQPAPPSNLPVLRNGNRLNQLRRSGKRVLINVRRQTRRMNQLLPLQRDALMDGLQEFSDEHDLPNRVMNWRDRAKLKAQQLRDQARQALNQMPSREQLRQMASDGIDRAKHSYDRVRGNASDFSNRIRQERQPKPDESLEGNKTHSLLDDIKKVLIDIKQRLDDGILTQGMPEDGQLPKRSGKSRFKLGSLDFRISDIAKGLWKTGKGAIRFGAGVANSLVSAPLKAAYGMGKFALGVGSNAISSMTTAQYRRARGFVDIYVGNEQKPRMYARMLQEGNVYFDQTTKKPIRRLKDITGTVVKRNPSGEEEVVLEDTEIAQAWCRDGVVKKTLKAMGVVTKSLLGIGRTVGNIAFGSIPLVYRLGIASIKKLSSLTVGLTDRAQDIFVKDRLSEPAMTARLMRAGSYRSAVTGNVISKPSQIDGPVLIGEETVLTHDDIRKGLVDKNNRPIRTGVAKLLGVATDAIKKTFRFGKKVFSMGRQLASDAIDKTVQVGKGVLNAGIKMGGFGFDLLRGKNPFTTMVAASEKTNKALLEHHNKSNDLLKQIRDILDQRLPAKKRNRHAGTDENGIRAGSYEDQQRKQRQALMDEAALTNTPNGRRESAGLLGMGAGLLNKFKGKKEDEKEKDDGYGVMDQLGVDAAEGIGKRLWRGTKRLGGKLGRGLKGLGGKGLGLLGLGGVGAAGAMGATGAATTAAATTAATTGTAAAAGTAGIAGATAAGAAGTAGAAGVASKWGAKALLKGGTKLLGAAGAAYGAYSAYDNFKKGNYGEAALDAGLSVGGLALTGASLGAAGTAIAGIISAPVLLGALAVGALAVGAYYGYKYLTKRRVGIMSQVRYVQYGFTWTDEDHIAPVFGLEDKLKDVVIYDKSGAKLDGKKVDPKALIKDFDVDEKDTEQLNKWLSWFTQRFKPVFLTHVSALKGIAPDKWLTDVDKLEIPKMREYFKATKFPEGAYNATTSPFKDLKELPSTLPAVNAIIQKAEEELQKKEKESPQDSKTAVIPVATSLGVTAVGAAALTNKVKDGKDITPSKNFNPNIAAEVAKSNLNTSTLSVMGGQTSLVGSGVVLESLGVNRLDVVDTVRMKTYGLVKMELDKVKAIRSLETNIKRQIQFIAKQGTGSVASWAGSLEQVLKMNAPAFGVDTSNDDQSKKWLQWFNQRFLPVYLNYATLVKAQTGKDLPDEGKDLLKPNQQLDLVIALYTTSNRADGGMNSVWSVSTSPWDKYQLNSDVRSVDANVQGLKEMAKNTILSEPGANVANQPTASKSAANSGTAAKTDEKPGFFGNLWSKTKDLFSSSSTPATTASNAASKVTVSAPVAAATSTAGAGLTSGPPVAATTGNPSAVSSSLTGGREMTQPGKGTGGDINAIPIPKGNKSWAALKDTILAAAQMAGVDPKLMAAMAAIESGFNYTVKAKSSSATGLYQFIDETWETMKKRYGAKYGIDPNTPATDPRANALLGAEYIKENMNVLSSALKRPITDTDVYMAHFLGGAGAKRFLSADPNAIAASVMPKAAAANPTIFYNRNGTPNTVGQVYQIMGGFIKNRAKGFGIRDGSEDMVPNTPPQTASSVSPTTPTAMNASAKALPGVTMPGPAKLDVTKPTKQGIGAVMLDMSMPPLSADKPNDTLKTPLTPDSRQPTSNFDIPIGMTSGFVSPANRMADVAKQSQLQNEIKVSNLEGTNKILSDQLTVAKDTFNMLKAMAEHLMNKTSDKPAPAASTPPTSQQSRVMERVTQKLPAAPISMMKPAYPFGGN